MTDRASSVSLLHRLRQVQLHAAEVEFGAAMRADRTEAMRLSAAVGAAEAFEARIVDLNRRVYARLLASGSRGATRFEIADQAFDVAIVDRDDARRSLAAARAAAEVATARREAAARRLAASEMKAAAAAQLARSEAQAARRTARRRENGAIEDWVGRWSR